MLFPKCSVAYLSTFGENIISAWKESVLIENQTAAYITGLTHRIKYPKRKDDAEKSPVLVLLHGRHGNEDVPWIFARNIPENWLIVSPRAIEFEPETPDHETGYSWIEMPEEGWPTIDHFDGAVQALSDFIIALPDVYHTDPDNVIVLGFSQGAATALATAIEYPKICRGVASLVGFAPTIDAHHSNGLPLKDVAVFMAIGDRDERIPLEVSTQSRETLVEAGADLSWELYRTGHKLNGQGMRDLATWLSKMMG